MGWEQLKAILHERRREAEISRQREQDLCPHDGWPLEEKPDGTKFCRYDGQIHPFDFGSD